MLLCKDFVEKNLFTFFLLLPIKLVTISIFKSIAFIVPLLLFVNFIFRFFVFYILLNLVFVFLLLLFIVSATALSPFIKIISIRVIFSPLLPFTFKPEGGLPIIALIFLHLLSIIFIFIVLIIVIFRFFQFILSKYYYLISIFFLLRHYQLLSYCTNHLRLNYSYCYFYYYF